MNSCSLLLIKKNIQETLVNILSYNKDLLASGDTWSLKYTVVTIKLKEPI